MRAGRISCACSCTMPGYETQDRKKKEKVHAPEKVFTWGQRVIPEHMELIKTLDEIVVPLCR